MPSRKADTSINQPKRTVIFTLGVLVALVLLRFVSGFIWPIPLQLDEAQYLGWSRDLALGYYSKPPMISWVLATNLQICDVFRIGPVEACARLSQSLALGLAAIFSGFAAWELFKDKAIAFTSVLLLSSSPLFGFYSLFATTDAWLLLCWSGAFWLFSQAVQSDDSSLSKWATCGFFVGLGLLAKYSMGIFILSALIWLLTQRRLWTTGPWVAAAVAILVFAPNLAWNAKHGFPTLLHHAEISQAWNLRDLSWSFSRSFVSILEFSASQFFMIGPFALGWIVFRSSWRSGPRHRDTSAAALLITFAAPIFVVILLQALISRAHANWAAPAFITLSIYVSWLWFGNNQNSPANPKLWLLSNLIFGVVLSAALIIVPKVGYYGQSMLEIRAIEKLRGWREAAIRANAIASENGYAILAEDRAMLAALHAYSPNSNVPIYAFDSTNKRQNHYSWFYNISDLEPHTDRSILLLAFREPSEAALSNIGFMIIRRIADPTLERIPIGDLRMNLLVYELKRQTEINGN
jgi:4-amino-4-deoxy-L-arabinose transferase-like glycosyltransferase